MKKNRFLRYLIFGSALLSAVPAIAIVTPNPGSLLRSKNLLIIDGSETAGDHYEARIGLTSKFGQMRTLVGFTSTTVTPSTLPTNLDPYDIIIFNYWFNNHLSNAAFQNAFKAWVNSSNKKRGWLGMHTSGANEAPEWPWFRDSVSAMLYRVHSGQAQAGTIRKSMIDSIRNHPIMAGLPDTVRIPADEWYDFAFPPIWADVRVLYNLDEKTLPTQLPAGARMNPHPSAWFRENYRGNRFFYTALVHNRSGVDLTAHNDFFTSMMLRALEYLAGYQTTPIVLNGIGLYQKNALMHVSQNSISITANEKFKLDVYSLHGKRMYSATGIGAKKFTNLFQKSGFYVVKVTTKSTAYSQRVLVQY